MMTPEQILEFVAFLYMEDTDWEPDPEIRKRKAAEEMLREMQARYD